MTQFEDTIAVARGVAWRVLHTFFTNKAFLLPSVAFPLFFFTAFVGALSRIRDVPGFDFPTGYTAFQFVFVLLQSAAFAGVFTGFGIARDFESGFMRRLMVAAPNRGGILLGYALSALVRWLTVVSIVTVVALLAHMQVGGNGVELFGLYLLGLLLNLAGALWAAGVAMRLRTQQAAPVMQMPVFLILFFAPVYVPLGLLQGWIHGVASVNPVTALLEAGRGLISGDRQLTVAAFAIGIGLVVGFSFWAVRGLRRAEAAG
ncbi:MAG TPA: ABC transporter permease [Gaiellaceae bacterium]